MTKNDELHSEIMKAIESGKAKMRPRWHFILFSSFGIVGCLIVFLSMLYIVSLAMFFMRQSGAWFAPSFGTRGWMDFFYATPWLLLLLLAVFLMLLEILVRRYRFVYQKPLLASVLGILFVSVIGGYALAQTSFHRAFMPSPPGEFMRFFTVPAPGEMYRGRIIYFTEGGFVIFDDNGSGTTTVVITRHTRLPYGGDFATGTAVVIVGDEMGTDTVQAFGIREVDDW